MHQYRMQTRPGCAECVRRVVIRYADRIGGARSIAGVVGGRCGRVVEGLHSDRCRRRVDQELECLGASHLGRQGFFASTRQMFVKKGAALGDDRPHWVSPGELGLARPATSYCTERRPGSAMHDFKDVRRWSFLAEEHDGVRDFPRARSRHKFTFRLVADNRFPYEQLD
jgi:hypothetical protein